MMQREAKRWLEKSFPWWARRGGRDHIWLTAHDEGACYVWSEVWPSIMLTHWARYVIASCVVLHVGTWRCCARLDATAGFRRTQWLEWLGLSQSLSGGSAAWANALQVPGQWRP
jgi:hypothetical protein